MKSQQDNKANRIVRENKMSGSSSWQLDNPAINREIEGYASECSINSGEYINFFVNTSAKDFAITIFRMGWYQGHGGREVFKDENIQGVRQSIPRPNPDNGLVECEWPSSYTLTTSKEWVSGVYLAKLEESNKQTQSYIIFIIRNDEHAPDILFEVPMTTYQAYNFWGGKNFYEFGSGSNDNWGLVSGVAATKVSFKRPYVRSTNSLAAYGMGAGDFLTNTRPVTSHNYPISSAGWDYNMVRWLEMNGYDLGYSTSLDTHIRLKKIRRPKVFLAHGHNEYWTHEMRENLTLARDTGVHLAFISSNTMFWQIRLEESTVGNLPYKTVVCYKNKASDPIKGLKSTVNFRDIPEQGSEASLIGVNYILDPVLGDIEIADASHWIFKDTGLQNGDKLKGLLGYEVDAVGPNSPERIEILASSVCQNRDKSNYAAILKHMLSKLLQLGSQPITKVFGTSQKLSSVILTVIASIFFAGCSILAPWTLQQIIWTFGLFIGIFAAFFVAWFIKIINSGKVSSQMTIYTADSGALVFATGSMQWSWGLDDFNTPKLRPVKSTVIVKKITKNILRKMLYD